MADSWLLPLYLRRELTTDSLLREFCPAARRFDVVAYADSACTQRRARWPWHYSRKPDRRFRRVMLNCFTWRAVWLPDLPAGD